MPSINLEVNYFEHRKTVRLVSSLGVGTDLLPIRLWTYAAKHHKADGRLAGYLPAEIEHIMGWRGEKGLAVEALVKVGFLDPLPEGGYQVHDWLDHAGHLAIYSERAKAASAKRWSKKAKDCPPDASSIPSSIASRNASSNANAVQCNANTVCVASAEIPPDLVELAGQLDWPTPEPIIGSWLADRGWKPPDIKEALLEALAREKKGVAYVEAILARWARDGKPAQGGKTRGNGARGTIEPSQAAKTKYAGVEGRK